MSTSSATTSLLELAKQAGADHCGTGLVMMSVADIERFAELVRAEAKESEAKALYDLGMAEAVIALRDERIAELQPMAYFGASMLDAHREDMSDLDGDYIQNLAVEYGLLATVQVSEPCGEDCRCAEYHGEFPAECLRYTTATGGLVAEMIAAAKASARGDKP